MKKGKKRIFLVLAVFAAAAAALCWWQRNNIEALMLSMRLSEKDLTTRIEDNVQKVTDASQRVPGITIRDLTDEEKAALRDNTLSREEIIAQMTTPQQSSETSGTQAETPDASQSAPAVSQPAAADADRQKLSEYIAEIYIMKEEYNTWLADANQAAIDEFNALPQEQQTTDQKYAIGMRYLNLALEKEKECDAEMAAIETAIRELLVKLGEDISMVDDLHAAYLEEKALKKAYYLGLH